MKTRKQLWLEPKQWERLRALASSYGFSGKGSITSYLRMLCSANEVLLIFGDMSKAFALQEAIKDE